MRKTYKRFFGLKEDVLNLLWRTKLCLKKKNQITILLANGFLKQKLITHNERIEQEKLSWMDQPNKYLVFEACPKENLRMLIDKKISKNKEKKIDLTLKTIFNN